jgi:metalloendopeptidase OMA1, mitochondrial
MIKKLASLFVLVILVSSCVTTPVSNKSALILVPFEQELALGVQAFDEIKKNEKESTNTRLKEIVNRVGKRIAAVSDMPDLDWEFKLIESEQQNAFALPGGKVAIYTGILPVALNEAGLATIMGHEIGHAIARHGAQRMSQQMILQGAMSAAAVNISNPMIMTALGVGANIGITLPFSRANESEADDIGLVYMARAGYEPSEAINFWSRFNVEKKEKPPELLSTHPSDDTRIQSLETQLEAALKIYKSAPQKFGIGEVF